MPNTSFRVAFWALLISVGLCVVAASTNTRDARLALSYPRKELATPNDLQLARNYGPATESPAAEIADRMASLDPFLPAAVASQSTPANVDRTTASRSPEFRRGPDVIVPDPYERSSLDPIEPQLSSEKADIAARADESTELPPWSGSASTSPPAARARIASANPDQSFGQFPAWAQNENHGVYEELPPPPAKADAATSLDSRADELQLDELRRELAALKATQDALESGIGTGESESPNPPELAQPQPESSGATYGPVPARLPSQFSSQPRQLAPETGADATTSPPATVRSTLRSAPSITRSGISITAGADAHLWNLQFEHASVRDVLMSVGEMIGWHVVIEPDVEGDFTGTFTEADLEQSFAVVVKAHSLRVERRGDYILIGTRPQLESN